MVSHRHRCIFIHQRKTAGTSIISSFGLTPADADWHLFNDGTLSPEWSRRHELAPGYQIVAVVRNPWERFVSGWKYLPATRDRSLADVLRSLPADGHDHRHLTRPQTSTLLDESGRFVPDVVLRFERLADDDAGWCAAMGKSDASLPRLNVTPHAPYTEDFDETTRALFAAHFFRDIEMLGYRFDAPPDRPPGPPA